MPSLKTLVQFALLSLIASACSGGGCGGCGTTTPIPGGFPNEERVANAIQVRVTDSAIAAFEEDPASLVGPLLPGGQPTIDVPPSCGGDVEVCCSGGTPAASCGPVEIDLEAQAGDLPRLEINPIQDAQQVAVVIRARLKTTASIPVRYLGISCDIDVDSAAGARDEVTLSMNLNLPQDPDEATTRLEVSDETLDLENDDVTVGGGFLCDGVDSFLKGFIVDMLSDNITALLGSGLSDQMCSSCESGTTSECGAFADSCTDNTCMIGSRCEQRLGVTGRMSVASLFGGFSTGQLGSMDLYQVAGGYTESNQGGLSMGLYSGALPFAEARDRCGPPATPPPSLAIAQSSFFQGNTRPDTAAPFGVGFGIHQQVLDQFAYTLYESGALCLNIGASSVDLLTTDGLAPLLMPSVLELLNGTNSPIVIGLRPQAPPTIQIGAGTTLTGESGETIIDDPLLDVRFTGVEIDFFVMVDDQFIRTMTLKANIALPMNLEINELGEIQPVVGDLENAITDIEVSNSQALRETDEELETKIPLLLSLALGPLVDSLGSFALPSFGGLNIQIAEDGIVSIEDQSFLAIFADFALQSTSARVHTEAELEELIQGERPIARLRLGGDRGDLEFSFRVDGAAWSPYTEARRVSLYRPSFHLPGPHRIEVRARRVGRPQSADLSPQLITLSFNPQGAPQYFHGASSGAGCNCNSAAGSATSWMAAAMALLFLVVRRRRPFAALLRQGLRGRAGLLGLCLALSIGSQACSCGSDAGKSCPDGCLEGEVERGTLGRYSSLAVSAERVVAAAYEDGLGDLVLVERDSEGTLQYRAIAGVPDEAPTYEPETYRGGVASPGPDVGIWTSIALHEGRVAVAYVDRETGSVYLAREAEDGSYSSQLVDGDTGPGGASYISLSLSSQGDATIAYMTSGQRDGQTILSQLRAASESTSFAPQIVDVGPISCGGYCADDEVCIAGEGVSECVSESGSCTACQESEACIEGSCVARIEAPTIHDIPEGVGLFARVAHLGDDSMVLAYYDRILGAVQIASSVGTGFAPAASYDDALDTGMWLSMAVDDQDLVHLAFQDASGDRLMYASFDGQSLLTENVDQGIRDGEDRSHPVGASAAIVVGGDRIPRILYQDALTSDVELASREQGSWQRSSLMSGDRLDGFYIDAQAAGEQMWMSHFFYDRSQIPSGELEIVALP